MGDAMTDDEFASAAGEVVLEAERCVELQVIAGAMADDVRALVEQWIRPTHPLPRFTFRTGGGTELTFGVMASVLESYARVLRASADGTTAPAPHQDNDR